MKVNEQRGAKKEARDSSRAGGREVLQRGSVIQRSALGCVFGTGLRRKVITSLHDGVGQRSIWTVRRLYQLTMAVHGNNRLWNCSIFVDDGNVFVHV